MFGKKKKFERDMDRLMTTTGLLKAAAGNDKDMMMAMVMGKAATDDGLWFALQVFITVAHRHPVVIERLSEIREQVVPKAYTAFDTTILAARADNPALYRGGDIVGQGLVMAYLAGAIAEDDGALAEVQTVLSERLPGGK